MALGVRSNPNPSPNHPFYQKSTPYKAWRTTIAHKKATINNRFAYTKINKRQNFKPVRFAFNLCLIGRSHATATGYINLCFVVIFNYIGIFLRNGRIACLERYFFNRKRPSEKHKTVYVSRFAASGRSYIYKLVFNVRTKRHFL